MQYPRSYALLLLLPLTLFSAAAAAADYYLATDGDDGDSGSEAKPWRTLAMANRTLQPGDTLWLRGGSWRERIIPSRSGRSGAPISYRAYPGEVAKVVGDGSANPIVYLSGRDYITLDGLTIRYASLPAKGNLQNILVSGGGHHRLLNLTIVGDSNFTDQRGDGYRETGIQITDGSVGNEVAGCRIQRMSLHAIAIGSQAQQTHIHDNDLVGNAMNSVTIGNSRYLIQGTLIERNLLGGSTVSDGIQTDTNYDLSASAQQEDTGSRGVVVRNNIIRDNAENAIDLKSAARWVIEDNLIFGASGNNDGGTKVGDNRFGGMGIHKGSQRRSEDVIIRRNIVYDNSGGIIVLRGYKVYNNTVLNNRRDYTGSNSSWQGDSETFAGLAADWGPADASMINNIIADNRRELLLRSGSGQEIDYNLYYNSWQSPHFTAEVSGRWQELEFSAWRSWLESAAIEGADRHSQALAQLPFSAPEQVTGEQSRSAFEPYPSSAAVDGGRPLTSATNSGSDSRSLQVADAGFFFDGYGITDGDTIQIGEGEPVAITQVDYDRNTLTLARAMSWSRGVAVTLPYAGSAPDIGALEFYDTPRPPAVPSGVELEVVPLVVSGD